jgi:ribosomal protein S18 acetylase RimI-like enzyme
VRIDVITSATAARLVPLNAVVQDLHAGHRPDIFRADTDAAQVERLFRDALERSDHFALVAVDPALGDLGYAYCEILDTPQDALTHARRRGVLHHIAVLPAARRQGVASALVAEVKRRFVVAGAAEWTASYHVWNDASSALLFGAGLVPTIIRAEGRL